MSENKKLSRNLWVGASVLALSLAAQAQAQTQTQTPEAETEEDIVVVKGIRKSLGKSLDVKRDAKGIVDAITAEDIGKFPDTNLAESLQRISGVAVDRSLGEGSSVTVRGFGQDFNLVTFNGRLMPTSTLGDGASAPSTRNFDFGNLASEAVASVEIYKTSKANVPPGGIGATINIKTTKPLEASERIATLGVKGVFDDSQLYGTDVTPEISGLYSEKFLDDRLGVAVSASYQERNGGVTQANAGWRDALLGNQGGWGGLPAANQWNWNPDQGGGNRPGDTDVYAVPQNADYEFADFTRTRTNGQLTLQYDFTDDIRGTVDYTYSHSQVELERQTVGIWYNHGATVSAWTDGPVAGPIFYREHLGNSDLSYSGAVLANESENKSLGVNLEWQVNDRLKLIFDAHDSSAASKPGNKFGSSMSLGTAVHSVDSQTINFEDDLPVISVTQNAGLPDLFAASSIKGTGSSFRNADARDEIKQVRLYGTYEFDHAYIKSVDFGIGSINNQYKTQYGFIQTDSWGGLGTPDDYPDELFEWKTLPDKFDGISGADNPDLLPGYYRFDVAALADLMDQNYGICTTPWTGTVMPGSCIAEQDVDHAYEENVLSAFLQYNNTFDVYGRDANLAIGLRYETTSVDSASLQLNPLYTSWTGTTEIVPVFSDEKVSFEQNGEYDYLLPSIDFDYQPLDFVKIRAAYSQTITRPSYDNLRAGQEFGAIFRPEEASLASGNPDLNPYKSTNLDFSSEWYYADDSYVSLSYFSKEVEDFIGTLFVNMYFEELTNPARGPRYDAAVAALGADAGLDDIRGYIIANYPDTVDADTGGILSQPEDDMFLVRANIPFNNDTVFEYKGLEFALQHMFGDTGFGGIINYTKALNDDGYDNTQPSSETQLVVTGWSDSANVIGFYENDQFQVRLAYNWREEFLGGSGPNPFYIEGYGQLDGSISYEFDNGLAIFGEGINITAENRRGHRRHENNAFFMLKGEARYAIGARYNF